MSRRPLLPLLAGIIAKIFFSWYNFSNFFYRQKLLKKFRKGIVQHIDEFIRFLKAYKKRDGNPIKQGTINNRIRNVRTFKNWLYERDMIEYYLYRMDNPDVDLSSRISKLKANYPYKSFVMITEAGDLYSKKEYKKAIDIYTAMWERFDFAPSLNMMGYANMQLGNMEAARSAFEDYIYNSVNLSKMELDALKCAVSTNMLQHTSDMSKREWKEFLEKFE